jgi:hypothetical protein
VTYEINTIINLPGKNNTVSTTSMQSTPKCYVPIYTNGKGDHKYRFIVVAGDGEDGPFHTIFL